jgi:hypothetical protein
MVIPDVLVILAVVFLLSSPCWGPFLWRVITEAYGWFGEGLVVSFARITGDADDED